MHHANPSWRSVAGTVYQLFLCTGGWPLHDGTSFIRHAKFCIEAVIFLSANTFSFLANVTTLRSLYVIAIPFVVCLLSVCRLSSVMLVHPTQAVELFRNFFYHTIAQGLYFSGAKNRWWGMPLPPEICVQSDPPPFQTAKFRPISAPSASTMIASEKSSIITYRKSTTRFPTSHRWTVYVTPKSPKRWHKNVISLFVSVKFNVCRKKFATKFLCIKTSSGKVVATSFPYPTVYRSIAGDVPIYLKLAFKVTHPSENADFQSFRIIVLTQWQRRPRHKYSITARWKFCSRIIISRLNAQYLFSYSYRLIC